MVAAIKWRAQRLRYWLLAALCILLVVTSQLASSSRQDHRQLLEKSPSKSQLVDPGDLDKGAPFIQLDDSKAKISVSDSAILGPYAVLTSEQLQSLPKISRDWDSLKIQMHSRLDSSAFWGPPSRSCFLWLEACFDLAVHHSILKAVRSILGDPVLLYGVSVWTAPPQSDQPLNSRLEAHKCETVDVLVNSGLRYVSDSHKLSLGAMLATVKQMQAVARVYSNQTRASLHRRIDEIAVSLVRRTIPKSRAIRLNPRFGEAYILHGRLLYAAANPTNIARAALLLQFASGDCKLRDFQPNENFNTVVPQALVPPAVMISSNNTWSKRVFRPGYKDVQPVAAGFNKANSEAKLLDSLQGSRITLFRDKKGPRFGAQTLGSARSPVLKRITIERAVMPFVRDVTDVTPLPLEFKSYSDNQLVVVFKKWMRHHYATTVTTAAAAATAAQESATGTDRESGTRTAPAQESPATTETAQESSATTETAQAQASTETAQASAAGATSWTSESTTVPGPGTSNTGTGQATGTTTGYREILELGVGDVAFLRKGLLHALEMPPGSEFMSISWSSSSSRSSSSRSSSSSRNLTRKIRSKGKSLFEMPASELGAINAETLVVKSGQAYDPDNEADCDVVVVVLKGVNLQVVPFQESVHYNEAALIPAGESCILWNAGVMPVTILAIQLYASSNNTIATERDAYLVEASYRARGKVM